MRKNTKFIWVGLTGILLILTSYFVYNISLSRKPRKTSYFSKVESELRGKKSITGEITALDYNFIAVTYRKDEKRGIEYEIAFPLNKDVKVINRKGLNELLIGDIITLTYDEINMTGKDGIKRRKRILRTIKVLSPLP